MKADKEKLFIFIFVFSVAISKNHACFTSNREEIVKVHTGSSFYQECVCEEPGVTGVNLKWLDIHDNEIKAWGPGTKSNVYSEWTDKETHSVYISNVSKSISGPYKCVTDHNGRRYSMTYNVEAYDAPYFVNTKETQYVVSGKDALIVCEARGENKPLITWYKEQDGFTEIENDEKYEIAAGGLIIKKITKDDEGIYKCTASDMETGEGIDRDILVEVISTPTIVEIEASPDNTVFEGGALSIECRADGIPHPEYKWTKVTNSSEAKANVTWKQEANTIVFEEVRSEDRGTYECNAINIAGSAAHSIHIEVLLPPVITEFENITAVEGSVTQIVCKASGRPIPKINLEFLGDESDEQSIVWDSKQVNETEVEFYLSFLRVNRTHDGIYICNASNEVDIATQEMKMTVLYPPYFDDSLENAWSWRDRSVNLSCEHHSNPEAEVTWKYQFNEIPTENQIEINKIMADKLHNVHLEFENRTLYGIYECVAKNEFGEAKKIITLREGFAPSVVDNVMIVNITSTSITFDIDLPDVIGPSIIGFTSEYDESDNYNITDIHISRTWSIDRPYRIDRLSPNTSYYIKFAAINDVGNGPWSDIYDFVTLEKSSPEEPVWDTDVEEIVATDRVLKWKPADTSEPIDHYAIRFCPMFNGLVNDSNCKEKLIEPTEELELNEMEVNATYYIELVAHNSVGNSSAAHIIITIPGEQVEGLPAGALIGVSIFVVFLCLITLDVLLLLWRKQGIIANCCYKKKKSKREASINSRDKKGLLKDNCEGDTLHRARNGHKEYEYNKNTGVITGKHSAV